MTEKPETQLLRFEQVSEILSCPDSSLEDLVLALKSNSQRQKRMEAKITKGIVDTISQLHGSASYQPLHKSRVGKCTG